MLHNFIEYLYYFTASILIRLFTKIVRNRIIIWSYHYNKYSCNPKAISDYLISNYGNDVEIFWVFSKKVNTDEVNNKIKIVRWKSLHYFYILYSSKIIITNSRIYISSFFLKKKNQIYLQTWHSSMRLKKVEKDAEKNLPFLYKLFAMVDSAQCNYILSGSKFSSETIKRAFWHKNAKILEFGTPRNDILFTNKTNLKLSICNRINVPLDRKIIIYAPTFRKNFNLTPYNLDYNKVLSAFESFYMQECILLLRLHPSFATLNINFNSSNLSDSIIDVTTYNDMQELLLISDVLITDYSSSMFDFSLCYKPCFIYASDYAQYDRGTYFDFSDLPFPFSNNLEDLIHQILNFNFDEYTKRVGRFLKYCIGSFENGYATKHICDLLTDKMK